jgi:Putative MetA-pathway of phenol degradation
MKENRLSISLVLFGFMFLVLPFLLSAQGFQMEGPPADKTTLALRFIHPDVEDADGLSIFTGLYQLSIRVPVNKKLNLVARAPFGVMKSDNFNSESGIGDIYAGLQYKLKDSKKNKTGVSLGIYLPTASKEKPLALFAGMFSQYSRFFQFLPEIVTISMNVTHYRFQEKGLFFGVELGPDVILPKEEYYSDQVELFVHYGLTVGYRFNRLEMKAEFVGFGIITEDVDDFGDRFIDEFILGLKWTGGRIHPGFFYKFNLDKWLRESVRGAFGFGIDFVLK